MWDGMGAWRNGDGGGVISDGVFEMIVTWYTDDGEAGTETGAVLLLLQVPPAAVLNNLAGTACASV